MLFRQIELTWVQCENSTAISDFFFLCVICYLVDSPKCSQRIRLSPMLPSRRRCSLLFLFEYSFFFLIGVNVSVWELGVMLWNRALPLVMFHWKSRTHRDIHSNFMGFRDIKWCLCRFHANVLKKRLQYS